MLRNYMRVALRSLWKNRLHTFFNVLGLSMGVGVCITVFLMVYATFHMDDFHPDANRVYMIGHVKELKGGFEKWGMTPAALAPSITASLPEVEQVIRVDELNASVRYGDKLFSERVHFSETQFLDMFSFPLEQGSRASLADPSAILISHETAIKYFGDEPAVGKAITVRFDDEHRMEFTVGGVFAKYPRTASFGFDFLANYDVVKRLTDRSDAWDYVVAATFVRLRAPEADFDKKLQPFVQRHNEVRPQQPIHSFFAEPLLTLSNHASDIRGDIANGINPNAVTTLSLIAGLVMLMACFNFMNNMIGTSAKRFKEVGVRKVVGGTRGQLMRQFLGESLLLSFLSLGLGFVLAEAFFSPFMAQIAEGFSFELNWSEDGSLFVFLIVLVSGTGILAGLYPSLMLSGYHPARIFRDLARVGSQRWLTRTLVVLQFAICLFAIVAAIVFKQNNDFLADIDVGFRGRQVAVLNFGSAAEWQTYRNAIAHQPGVVKIVGSRHQLGENQSVGIHVESEGASFQSNVVRIGQGYFDMMEMGIREGRAFDEKLQSDVEESVMVNEVLVKRLGWTQPVGRRIRLENRTYTVIGVAENFYSRTFMRPIDPVVLKLVPEQEYRFMSIQLEHGRVQLASDALKTAWQTLMPYEPFQLRFQDEVFEEDYRENENIRDMFVYVAAMTMLIAATGLFALISVNIARRTKEIGIRKVMGASPLQIMQLVNREFYMLILVASALIFPLAYVALGGLLDAVFASHVEVSLAPFVGAALAMLLLAVLTIGSRVARVAVENPVHALRYE